MKLKINSKMSLQWEKWGWGHKVNCSKSLKVSEDTEERVSWGWEEKLTNIEKNKCMGKVLKKKKRQIEGGWFYSGARIEDYSREPKRHFENLIGGYEESLTHWPNKQITKTMWLDIIYWSDSGYSWKFVLCDSGCCWVSSQGYVSCWQAVLFTSTIRFCKSVDIIFLHHCFVSHLT